MKSHEKIGLIADALHYVRRYAGKTVVIKYGGNAMTDTRLQLDFARDIILLKLVGILPVIVHGGGPYINDALAASGKKSKFIDGLRYTDDQTMTTVERVLGGEVNQRIVEQINTAGGAAVGLTGKDGWLIRAKKFAPRNRDIGRVGEVQSISTKLISLLDGADFIPVIAPIGADANGRALNINADSVAAELAVALRAQALFIMTNVSGVLDKSGKLIPQLSVAQARRMLRGSGIVGGMKPKLQCAARAVSGGVASCQIIDGTTPRALLLEIFTNQGAGTFIS